MPARKKAIELYTFDEAVEEAHGELVKRPTKPLEKVGVPSIEFMKLGVLVALSSALQERRYFASGALANELGERLKRMHPGRTILDDHTKWFWTMFSLDLDESTRAWKDLSDRRLYLLSLRSIIDIEIEMIEAYQDMRMEIITPIDPLSPPPTHKGVLSYDALERFCVFLTAIGFRPAHAWRIAYCLGLTRQNWNQFKSFLDQRKRNQGENPASEQ